MKQNTYFFVFLILFSLFLQNLPLSAHGDEVYTFIVKKQEHKAKSRWSLSEWLDTRDRMRMMDLWLALHSPSPYEFYLGGASQFGLAGTGQSYTGGIGYFAAYASIVGLEIQRDQSFAQIWNLIFHLRLFGRHNQATNLTLNGGLRYRGGFSGMRSPFAGASLTLYLLKFFGVNGEYRHFFKSSKDGFNNSVTGNRIEANAFIDFSFIRLYGGYFQEYENSSLEFRQNAFPKRSGYQAGLRFYF